MFSIYSQKEMMGEEENFHQGSNVNDINPLLLTQSGMALNESQTSQILAI